MKTDYYDKIWGDHIMPMATAMKAEGIPDAEVPPALSDFALMLALVLGIPNALSVEAGDAIIERMKGLLVDFQNGEGAFTEFNEWSLSSEEGNHEKE